MATQEGAVDTHSNASRAGEVERKLWLDKHFFLQRSFSERRSPLSASPKRGSDAVALLILEQLRAKAASMTLVTLPIVYCAQLVSGVRPRA